MNGDNQEPDGPQEPADGSPDPRDAELEIARRRACDLATAIARAGAGNLKGASPIPTARQALLTISSLLAAHLRDSEGSLTRTLQARLQDDPPLLDRHRDRPAAALAELLDRVLEVPAELAELVRETDARWGREYDERPRFELAGRPTATDDPYTEATVRGLLVALRSHL